MKGERGMSGIKQYIYFDQKQIDSVCAQAGVVFANKKTVIRTQENASSFKSSSGLKKLIKIGVAGKKDNKKGVRTESELIVFPEQKIDKLESCISKSDKFIYHTNLNEAIKSISIAPATVFINVCEEFYAPSYRENPDNLLNIYKSGYIDFVYGKPQDTILAFGYHYDKVDTYNGATKFESDQPVSLLLLFSKFVIESDTIYPILSNWLFHGEGKLRLGVFGFLNKHLDKTKYFINPLAVWIS